MRERAVSCQSITAPLGEHLRETAQALALTPKQLPLWESYQESISALMGDQMKPDRNTIRKTALLQINAKVDTVRNRLAAMEEIADRARILYQSLDEKQKKTADLRLSQTVPALYSGTTCQPGQQESSREKGRPGERDPGGPRGSGGGMGRF